MESIDLRMMDGSLEGEINSLSITKYNILVLLNLEMENFL